MFHRYEALWKMWKSCVINVVMLIWHLLISLHAFEVHRIMKKNDCGACGELNWRKHILDALLICKWCTIFLFSMLYKIPFFCVVQNSCFLWCTIFLKNGMMYLIPVWHVVPSSVVGKSVFSNFECCTIFWCIQVCVPFNNPTKTAPQHNTNNNKKESSLMSTQTVCPYVCLCLCACKWEKINVMKIPSKCSETLAFLTCP